MARGKYIPKNGRTMDGIVDEKMKVLEQLTIVNAGNSKAIRERLVTAIKQHPDADMFGTVDRVAMTLISEAFN